jgi:pSer/pThr/pTyr-binding forkhead associated (FHA) protein
MRHARFEHVGTAPWYFGIMQAACIHCGRQHILNDEVVTKHPKVQFRCSRCGQTTIVEIKRRADETVVISPMPSFARADASTASLKLPPVDETLHLPAGVSIVLSVVAGPFTGVTYPLTQPRTVIGRKGADFALDDPELSRHHCVLEVREFTISLKDLESTNGTFFGDERIRAAVLQEGAEFRVGTNTIRLNFQPT